MIDPAPYFTFWQVAEKWAEESKKPVMDVIQIMRVHSTYKYLYPTPCPIPSLTIVPTAFISAQGDISESSIYNASKLIEKELKVENTSKYRANYHTPEYSAAMTFLNSSECPPVATEEIKKHLSQFAVLREDFRKWCMAEGEALPKFWFSKKPSVKPRNDLLNEEIHAAIDELGGEPSAKAVMKKLKEYAGSPESRIIKAVPTGVVWRNSFGNEKLFEIEALQKRLSRIRR